MYEKLIRRQYGVVIAFSGISLSLFVTPYCPTITYLFVSVGFLGLSCGAYDTAQASSFHTFDYLSTRTMIYAFRTKFF